MTPSKAIGLLSIFAGITSCIGIVDGVSILFTTPIGVVSGSVAVYKQHRLLGSLGIILSVLAPAAWIALAWHWGWLDGTRND